jgi:uncharacterized protein YdeI (BOF family)
VKKTMLMVAGLLLPFTFLPRPTLAVSPRASLQEQQSPEKAKVFSGTIIKNGDSFVLSDTASKLSYKLDDPAKASQFEGKKVKVTGTVDVGTNTIHVETIQEIA